LIDYLWKLHDIKGFVKKNEKVFAKPLTYLWFCVRMKELKKRLFFFVRSKRGDLKGF